MWNPVNMPRRQFIKEAIEEKLKVEDKSRCDQAWRQLFGKLKHLRPETRRIDAVIAEEFERIDPGEWS
jgi:hypothetical protein